VFTKKNYKRKRLKEGERSTEGGNFERKQKIWAGNKNLLQGGTGRFKKKIWRFVKKDQREKRFKKKKMSFKVGPRLGAPKGPLPDVQNDQRGKRRQRGGDPQFYPNTVAKKKATRGTCTGRT